MCVRGELDVVFTDHMRQVYWSPALFAILPTAVKTEATPCLALRAFCRIAAEYERLIASPHRRTPFALFMATQSRRVARDLQELHRKQPCLFDRFSCHFLDKHDLGDEGTLAILRCIMSAASVDTSKIECWHAWVRRVITRLGTQTHRPNSHSVLCRQFAQRVKRRSAAAEVWNASDVEVAVGPEAAPPCDDAGGGEAAIVPARGRKRGGGGGQWRLHVGKKIRGGEIHWKQFASSYRARTDEEVAEDEREGRAGAERRRVGLPTFGPTQREIDRARIANEATVLLRQQGRAPLSLLDAPAGVVAPSLSACTAESYKHMLRVVRKADKIVVDERKRIDTLSEGVSSAFAHGHGRAARDALLRDAPPLSDALGDLAALPEEGGALRMGPIALHANMWRYGIARSRAGPRLCWRALPPKAVPGDCARCVLVCAAEAS